MVDIFVYGGVDVFIGWFGCFCQKCCCCYNLVGLVIIVLWYVEFILCCLDSFCCFVIDIFDGGDFSVFQIIDYGLVGVDWYVVLVDSVSFVGCNVVIEFGFGYFEFVLKGLQQWIIRICVQCMCFFVDFQSNRYEGCFFWLV